MKTDTNIPNFFESKNSDAVEFAESMGLKRSWHAESFEMSAMDFASAMGLRHSMRSGETSHRRKYAGTFVPSPSFG
jgi:hypothetical protein